jgi:hypothetical protein
MKGEGAALVQFGSREGASASLFPAEQRQVAGQPMARKGGDPQSRGDGPCGKAWLRARGEDRSEECEQQIERCTRYRNSCVQVN